MVNVMLIVLMIVPNHFHFVLGLKLFFSTLITNPAETKSFLMSSPTVLESSKLQDVAMMMKMMNFFVVWLTMKQIFFP